MSKSYQQIKNEFDKATLDKDLEYKAHGSSKKYYALGHKVDKLQIEVDKVWEQLGTSDEAFRGENTGVGPDGKTTYTIYD